MSKGGPVVDEHYLNQRIIKLNLDRQRIHELAAKYGIENKVRVQHLQLIQIGGRPLPDHEGGSPPKNYLGGISDQKERIQEYHHRVNERRKKIYERQQAKKREQEELSQTVLGGASGSQGHHASSIKKAKKSIGTDKDAVGTSGGHLDELEEERMRQESHMTAKKKKNKQKKGAGEEKL